MDACLLCKTFLSLGGCLINVHTKSTFIHINTLDQFCLLYKRLSYFDKNILHMIILKAIEIIFETWNIVFNAELPLYLYITYLPTILLSWWSKDWTKDIKLRMEIGNVSQRQQLNHKTDNTRRSLIGICFLFAF